MASENGEITKKQIESLETMDKYDTDKYLTFLELVEEGQMPHEGQFKGQKIKSTKNMGLTKKNLKRFFSLRLTLREKGAMANATIGKSIKYRLDYENGMHDDVVAGEYVEQSFKDMFNDDTRRTFKTEIANYSASRSKKKVIATGVIPPFTLYYKEDGMIVPKTWHFIWSSDRKVEKSF